MTLVATIASSQAPASAARVVALSRTVRSPLAPSQRRPRAAMASTCSCHLSNIQTSLPASASSAPYTDPIAPLPTMPIFMMPPTEILAGPAPRLR